jgi:hypothetical protein
MYYGKFILYNECFSAPSILGPVHHNTYGGFFKDSIFSLMAKRRGRRQPRWKTRTRRRRKR